MDYKAYETGQRGKSFWDIADNELKEILLTKTRYNNNEQKILNIGCGTAEDIGILERFGETYLSDIDIRPLKIIKCNDRTTKIVADAENLPFQDNTFGIVCMFGSIEHINDDRTAIEEAERVLVNGGFLILTGPAHQALYSCHDKILLHFRRYNKKQLRVIMPNNLKEICLSYWNSILFMPIAMMKILNRNKEPKLHNVVVPKWVDRIILTILRLENLIVKKNIEMPIGVNFYGIYQKTVDIRKR
jgi:SAM-dependent methyltransferase